MLATVRKLEIVTKLQKMQDNARKCQATLKMIANTRNTTNYSPSVFKS